MTEIVKDTALPDPPFRAKTSLSLADRVTALEMVANAHDLAIATAALVAVKTV